MANHLIYYLFRLFRALILYLPKGLWIGFFKTLGGLVYRLNTKHRRIILANLDHAYGDTITRDEKEAIAKQCFQNFFVYAADFVHASNQSPEYLKSHVTVENEHILDEALARGEKIILVSAHYGVWEMILHTVGAFKAPIATIAERIRNSERLNETLAEYRQKNNVVMFKKRGALVKIVKALREGNILAYLVDQSYSKGLEVTFFGQPVLHVQSASQLSRKYGALLLPVFCTTDDYKTYTIRFQEPFTCEVTEDEETDILRCTQRQSDIIEQAVRERPADYFWFHKKFKAKSPELYRNL